MSESSEESDAPTCSHDGCDDDAVAEVETIGSDEWDPLCAHHAQTVSAEGEVVRPLDESDDDRTFECPHCGGETFGLVVKNGSLAYARCRLCDEEVLNQ